jgi:exopolysaccharide production protein ExoQ
MRKHINIAVWTTVLYLFVITTNIFSFWQEAGQVAAKKVETGNVILSLIGILVVMVIVPQLLKKNALGIIRLSWPFILVLMFSLMSCLWSELPFIAFRRFTKVLIIVICVLNLLSENDFGASFKKSIFIYIILTILTSLVFILFFPRYGWMQYEGRFLARGIMSHKNGLSDYCAVSVLFVLWIKTSRTSLARIEEVLLVLIGIISFIFLCLGQGVDASLSLAIALIWFIIGVILNRIGTKKSMAFFALICSFISVNIVISLLWLNGYIPTNLAEIVVTSVGKDMTFTGRVQLWQEIAYFSSKTHPFLGYGFGTFFVSEESSLLPTYLNWAYSAHSGYLKLFVELGIVGTIIFCLFLGHLAISIFTLKNVNYKEKSALQALLLYALCHNIVSDSFLVPQISFLIIIMLSFYTAAINSHVFRGNMSLVYFKRRRGSGMNQGKAVPLKTPSGCQNKLG